MDPKLVPSIPREIQLGKWMVKKWLKRVVEGVLVGICDGEVVLFCMLDRFPVDLYKVILWETLLDCLQY